MSSSCPDCCPHCTNKGLLIIRIGLGALLAIYGAQLLFAGIDARTAMGIFVVGDTFPALLGAAAASILFLGGLCLAMGLFRKASTLLLGVVMLAAAFGHFQAHHPLFPTQETSARHALNLAIIMFGLASIGAGTFTMDKKKKSPHEHPHAEK